MHDDPFNGDAGPPLKASWMADVQSTVIGYIILIPAAWATSNSGRDPWRKWYPSGRKKKTHARRPEPDGAGESIRMSNTSPKPTVLVVCRYRYPVLFRVIVLLTAFRFQRIPRPPDNDQAIDIVSTGGSEPTE